MLLDMKYLAKVMDSILRKVETSEAKPFSRPWKSSDLILKVTDREFHVHRAVLILCSPVFEASLSSSFEGKSVKEILLPGKEATEIEQMLQSIYPDQDLQISKENCLALLKLSTEYQIDRLKTRCEEYLRYWCRGELTIAEALEVIIVNQRCFLEDCIVKKCLDMLVSQTGHTWEQIQKHERYSELEKETVKWLTEERVNHLEKMLNIGDNATATPFGYSGSNTGSTFSGFALAGGGTPLFGASNTPFGIQPQRNTMFTAGTGGENAGIVGKRYKKAVRRTKR